MTAQIAILNKHGIALATDSAVTITGNDNQKVYNTANKLFALSNQHPVGIMVYGSAQFMNVPWETIIKSYRKELGQKSFNHLKEYTDSFIEYIKNSDILTNNFAYESTLIRTLTTYLKVVLNQVSRQLNDFPDQEKTPELVSDLIGNETDRVLEIVLRKVNYLNDFDEAYIEKNLVDKNSLLEDIINNNIFVPIDLDLRNKIKVLLVTLIAKDFFTNTSSGVVISGYGENEIFPSMYEFKFEGIYMGKLKYKLEAEEVISSETTENSSTASIKAFAQREMVHTFMEGIDPKFKDEVFGSIYTILMEVYPRILKDNLNINLDEVEEQRLSVLSNNIFNEMEQKVREYQNNNFTFPIIDTIQLMPKEEIATVAETLLNLASLKKRVTMDTESVGGPIDVAIISKNDGLIWIKRKHYFTPELNYKYFNNNK